MNKQRRKAFLMRFVELDTNAAAVAAGTGINKGHLSRVINGHVNFKDENAEKVATFLQCSREKLMI